MLTDHKDECAQGVKVVLEKDGSQVASKETDLYGDFQFDGLEKEFGYSVIIDHSGYSSVTLEVNSKIDVHLGEIELVKG